MRKEAKTSNVVIVRSVSGYHCSRFQSIKAWLSDRATKVESYTELNRLGLTKKLIGLEIETEFDRVTNLTIVAEILQKVVFSHFPDDFFRIEHDASLENGAECVTQVGTKAFYRNQYKNFKTMYNDYFPSMGISCARTGHCGMHTNLSLANFGKTKEEQDLAIAKMHYTINQYYDFWCVMLGRNRQHTRYCSRMDAEMAKRPNFIQTVAGNNSHGIAINYGHYYDGRVELRLVGGQGTFGAFRNTMETIFFLLDRVRHCSWSDLDNMEKFFAGCNQYVFDRLTKANNCGVISQNVVDAIQPTVKPEDLI